ncbi:hypothetical protein C8R28_105810 [Nitrosomonas ureae]|uniref:Uncharacterized protein n=1 Tax=Nitrosomonas ureae TaxID=44577 RepID=A0A2T5I5F4_9PROT|nr:hypothetical protein C8R28_105810 [Nitrosomonas ureae]
MVVQHFDHAEHLYPKLLHPPLDCAASNANAFSQQLPPYFASTINPEVAFPYSVCIKFQPHVSFDAIGQSIRTSLAPFVSVITRRGNPYLPADWLDPVSRFVLIDKHHPSFRSAVSLLARNMPLPYAISRWPALIPNSPVPIP